MAQRSTPDGWRSPADAPSNVQVTVVPGPRAHPVRDRRAGIRVSLGLRAIMASLVLVAAVGATLAVALRHGRPVTAAAALRHGRAVRVAVPRPTPADIASVARSEAAYRYPLGCLGLALSADRSAMLGRDSPCWRYGVYVTAVLRQVNGMWRLMLEATSPKCPAVQLPDFVRSALIGCKRATVPGPSG